MPINKSTGISIYYEVHGQGEPLLMIIGLGSDITNYSPLINYLANDYQVIVLDNRGAGRSDKPNEPYSMRLWLKML